VYGVEVKRRDLESALRELGWEFSRHGGNHDIWSRGEDTMAVPRHNEINENLARSMLKKARGRR
jgi:mRNA interferase HicA